MRGMLYWLYQRKRGTTAYGYGGSVVVHEITGLALNRITRGKKEWTCSITEVIEQL
jgi:hypothetical protein